LKSLERGGTRAGTDLVTQEEAVPAKRQKVQLTLFEAEKHPVIEDLETLDVTSLTPIEAMMKLDDLARRAREKS
jgi:DNA mismatch repair protein MutS